MPSTSPIAFVTPAAAVRFFLLNCPDHCPSPWEAMAFLLTHSQTQWSTEGWPVFDASDLPEGVRQADQSDDDRALSARLRGTLPGPHQAQADEEGALMEAFWEQRAQFLRTHIEALARRPLFAFQEAHRDDTIGLGYLGQVTEKAAIWRVPEHVASHWRPVLFAFANRWMLLIQHAESPRTPIHQFPEGHLIHAVQAFAQRFRATPPTPEHSWARLRP